MQTRHFGRTGHMSTVAILGGFAFYDTSQEETDAAMEHVIAAGINHIDVAPSYGQAEVRLGPWMARERERFFLGCKTAERTKAAAAAELRASLDRLQVGQFDLYQLHAVTTVEELDQVTRTGGALEAILEAQQAGLIRFIGITGHGYDVPTVMVEALRRFDFDSVLFPVNFVQYAIPEYRRKAEELLRQCRAKDVGVMAIKTIARGNWHGPQRLNTWYDPFTDPQHIQQAVNFTLSQEVTGLITAGDVHLIVPLIRACENFVPLTGPEQEALIVTGKEYEPLFSRRERYKAEAEQQAGGQQQAGEF